MSVLETVATTINRNKMISEGDRLLIAVSGGPDSVALLHIMVKLAARYETELAIAHLNHGLRESEADRDEAFVRSLAEQYELPIFAEKRDVAAYRKKHRLCLEEAARNVRYAFFDDVSFRHGYHKLATGHQSDDNAEVFLMNLIRGAGPSGLSGIAPVRENFVIRPLIYVSRQQVLEYISENQLSYVVDSTNTSTDHLRNRVRHCLVPTLKTEYNPRICNAITRCADIIRFENEWMDQQTASFFQKALIRSSEKAIVLDIVIVNQHSKALIRRIYRKAIEKVRGNLRRIRNDHIQSIIQLCQSGQEHGMLDLPGNVIVHRCRSHVSIQTTDTAISDAQEDRTASVPLFSYSVIRYESIYLKEIDRIMSFSILKPGGIPAFAEYDNNTAFFDMDKIQLPLVIRSVIPGDRFRPLGMKGTQKLKSFFINQKVPHHRRRHIPLLVCQGHILWVAGYRIDDRFKLTSSTKNAIKVELLLA